MSIQQHRSYFWFGNCLTSRKTIFQSCWDGQVIRRRGFDFKSHQGVLHGGVLAYKGSNRGRGGGGGGRATLDIQDNLLKNDHSFMHLFWSLICHIKQSELYFDKDDIKILFCRFKQDCNRKGVTYI